MLIFINKKYLYFFALKILIFLHSIKEKNLIMNLKKILTISGQPDLFELISNTSKGIIVESIVTKKRSQAFAQQRVNSLKDIAVFTQEGEIPLSEVFLKIYKKEEGKQAISHKSNAADIKAYFEEFFPDYDREKVQFSAMKRIIKWYNMLNEHGFIDDKPDTEDEKDEKEEKDEKTGKDEKK